MLGVVWALSGDPFEQMMRVIESADSPEALAALTVRPTGEAAVGAKVSVRSGSRTWQATTNSRGRFWLYGLPEGTYEVVAESDGKDGEPPAMGVARVGVGGSGDLVGTSVLIRPDTVTVKGRICDDAGLPIAGARIYAEKTMAADDQRREGGRLPEGMSAVSDADGSFELRGFAPPDVRSVVAYLAGRGTAGEGIGTTAVFTVEAGGFQTGTLVVPLVAEDLANRARRFEKAIRRFQEDPAASQMPERPASPLPASRGNTIVGVNVTLHAAGE
jgi:hypothetical protein